MKDQPKHYTTHEVSRICGVAPITVGRWVEAGKIQAFRTVGGHRRILASSLDAFLERYRIPRAAPGPVSRRVLIVDDDDAIRQVTRELLLTIDEGLDIRDAPDGFEAGRLVASFRPHLVLLDLMMPGLDGFEVCRRIKLDPGNDGVEIVGHTGFFTSENRQRLLDAGALDCLKKPAAPEALALLLEQVFVSNDKP